MTNTNVMTKAWEIAREGAKKFGGKVTEYFSESLKIAWSIIKGASKIDEQYRELKFLVRAANLELSGKVDEMFMKVTDLIRFTGMTEEAFNEEIQYVDPSRATSFEVEVNGIICNVITMKKSIHEM